MLRENSKVSGSASAGRFSCIGEKFNTHNFGIHRFSVRWATGCIINSMTIETQFDRLPVKNGKMSKGCKAPMCCSGSQSHDFLSYASQIHFRCMRKLYDFLLGFVRLFREAVNVQPPESRSLDASQRWVSELYLDCMAVAEKTNTTYEFC